VTTLDDLVQAVNDYPTSDVVANMLIDFVMESHDMNRSEADKHVREIRWHALRTANMSLAGQLMNHDTHSRAFLLGEVFAYLGLADLPGYTLVILPGGASPDVSTRDVSRPTGYWPDATLTVGSQWLLGAWQRDQQRLLREARRVSRRARK